METLALDFDGVIRKFPYPIRKYVDFLSPHDLLVRARLFFIRKLLCKIFMHYTPIILDGKLINAVNKYWDGRVIVVTGRCKEKEKKEVLKLLLPYLKFDRIYFRKDCSEYEEKFKERVLREEKVNYFFEDREYVVKYLKEKGINVIKIEKVRRLR